MTQYIKNLSIQRFLLILLIISTLAVTASYISQYVFGLQPCHLCLYQRYGLIFTAVILAPLILLKMFTVRSLVVASLLFLTTAGIAGYHVLVEQKVINVPESCSKSDIDTDSFDLFKKQLSAQPQVSCDEIQFELFGISMAGYNFLVCFGLALLTIYFIRQKRQLL